jgi:hypothetical protein
MLLQPSEIPTEDHDLAGVLEILTIPFLRFELTLRMTVRHQPNRPGSDVATCYNAIHGGSFVNLLSSSPDVL